MSEKRLTSDANDARGIRLTNPDGTIVLPRNMKKPVPVEPVKGKKK